MACNTRCFSGPYYPYPIFFNSNMCSDSPNTVVNPPIIPANANFAFATTSEIGLVENGATVPLNITNSNGNSITMNVLGDISLSAGSYLVNYNLLGEIQDGALSFGLFLNGELIPTSQSQFEGTEGEEGMLSNQVIITTAQNAILTLRNIGSSAILASGNMSVTKL